MKAFWTVLTVAVFSTVLAPMAKATDEDDVKAAVTAMFTAYNTWDAETWRQSHTVPHTIFPGGQGLLAENTIDAAAIGKTWADSKAAGNRQNIQVRHLQVKVYGTVAVTTGYLVLSSTPATGTATVATWRSTMVWVKQGGKWLRTHYHSSVLKPAATP